MWIWIFFAKKYWIIVIMILNLNFDGKKFQSFQFLFFLCLHKITIFGAKIQIIKATLAFKNSQKSFKFTTLNFSENWIFGNNLIISNSVPSKPSSRSTFGFWVMILKWLKQADLWQEMRMNFFVLVTLKVTKKWSSVDELVPVV